MKLLHSRFSFLTTIFFGFSVSILKAEAQEENDSGSPKFQEITTDVPQDVTEIHLPPDCPSSGSHYPNTMFTILPSEDNDDGDNKVKIETYPADLVSATTRSGNSLRLKWNDDVASNANEGGVKIYFPPAQLYDVSTAADAKVQILDGFTSMENIKVSSDSKLSATLNSLSDEASLTMSVSSDAEVQIVSNGNFNHISVSSDAKVSLEAILVEHFKVSSDGQAEIKGNVGFADISSDAKLTIDGNLTDGGETSSDAKLTVYGSVHGHIRASSDSKVYIGSFLIEGNIDASSDAKVRAPNCNTVSTSSDAKCIVDDSIDGEVIVDVEVLPFTLTGRQRCWWGGGGFFSSGNMSGWQAGVLAVIIIAIVTCCGFGIWKCIRRNNNNNNNRERGEATEYNVTYPGVTTAIPAPSIPVKEDDEEEAKSNATATAAEEDPSAIAYKVDDHDKQQQHGGSNTAASVPAEAIAVVEHVDHTAAAAANSKV